MEKVKLEILALSHSITHSNNYAIILGEVGGHTRLPIVIGGFEAQAIAVALEGMVPNRPLTHDLFKNTLDLFKIKVNEVVINKLAEGVFYSILVCEKDNMIFNIDARTSDALAIAVRFEAPIYTYRSIMEIAGVELEEPTGHSHSEPKGDKRERKPEKQSLQDLDEKALTAMLNKALEKEEYEKAALIRDEMNRRKGEDNKA